MYQQAATAKICRQMPPGCVLLVSVIRIRLAGTIDSLPEHGILQQRIAMTPAIVSPPGTKNRAPKYPVVSIRIHRALLSPLATKVAGGDTTATRKPSQLDINSLNLDGYWLWAHFVYWPLLLLALYRAPWHILRQRDSSNVLFGAAVILLMIWQLRVVVAPGLHLHLLGTTVLTLMFNWQAALLAHALVLSGITLTSSADFPAFAVNGLLTGAIPIAISYYLWRFNERFLPANYFVYVFVAAFFTSALAIMACGLASYALLMAAAGPLPEETLNEYLLLYVPITYPEAFLSGGIISVLVLYRPQWIATFDDNRYLNDK